MPKMRRCVLFLFLGLDRSKSVLESLKQLRSLFRLWCLGLVFAAKQELARGVRFGGLFEHGRRLAKSMNGGGACARQLGKSSSHLISSFAARSTVFRRKQLDVGSRRRTNWRRRSESRWRRGSSSRFRRSSSQFRRSSSRLRRAQIRGSSGGRRRRQCVGDLNLHSLAAAALLLFGLRRHEDALLVRGLFVLLQTVAGDGALFLRIRDGVLVVGTRGRGLQHVQTSHTQTRRRTTLRLQSNGDGKKKKKKKKKRPKKKQTREERRLLVQELAKTNKNRPA